MTVHAILGAEAQMMNRPVQLVEHHETRCGLTTTVYEVCTPIGGSVLRQRRVVIYDGERQLGSFVASSGFEEADPC